MALFDGRKALLMMAVCASGAVLVGAAFLTGVNEASEDSASNSTEPEPEAQGAVAQGGFRAYVDSEGNVIPRPAGTLVPAAGARPKVIPVQKRSPVPGGGIYIDTRHIRAVSYATVNENGEVSVNCVTVHGTDIEEGLASRGIVLNHKHDAPSSR